MLELNDRLFLLLNARPDASSVVLAGATVIAADLIVCVPVLLVGLWIWGHPGRRSGLAATAIGAALALGANQIVGQFWYEPRPFMIGLGRTFVSHAAENSFPSDHTTFMFAIGIGLISTRAATGWGKIVVISGALVAWARIYLGLHFPIDICASVLIAGVFGVFAAVLVVPIQHWVMPGADLIYDGALDLMRLPARLFPRSGHQG